MRTLADAAVALVALLHVYFLVLEMFFSTRPFGLKNFGPGERQVFTSVIAMPSGLLQ